jgi:hypothetical protein
LTLYYVLAILPAMSPERVKRPEIDRVANAGRRVENQARQYEYQKRRAEEASGMTEAVLGLSDALATHLPKTLQIGNEPMVFGRGLETTGGTPVNFFFPHSHEMYTVHYGQDYQIGDLVTSDPRHEQFPGIDGIRNALKRESKWENGSTDTTLTPYGFVGRKGIVRGVSLRKIGTEKNVGETPLSHDETRDIQIALQQFYRKALAQDSTSNKAEITLARIAVDQAEKRFESLLQKVAQEQQAHLQILLKDFMNEVRSKLPKGFMATVRGKNYEAVIGQEVLVDMTTDGVIIKFIPASADMYVEEPYRNGTTQLRLATPTEYCEYAAAAKDSVIERVQKDKK